MKWLIGLSAAQTLLLSFVGLRVVSLEMRADDIADAADAARLAAERRPAGAVTLASPARTNDAASLDDMRALIREELAPLITAQTKAALVRPVSTAPQLTTEQVKRAEADFTQDLNIARSRSQTSEAEISDLYAKIARLPPSARQAALSQLAKAISSGEIDARL